ncbi:hypothetical protein DL96DRAFT_10950 [Flagelloscypha sp. PMI_526]|nr:hypothetical protein DL96DRAFT_10950 [Flagelloscypha sp. PMI_526]
MPRKAAAAAAEDGAPRRSSRIKALPQPADPAPKKKAPAKKKAADGEAPKKPGRKRKVDEAVEANGADEPATKKTKPDSKAKPSSKAKPASKASAKPVSKAGSTKPASRANSKKPVSKAGAEAVKVGETIAEDAEGEKAVRIFSCYVIFQAELSFLFFLQGLTFLVQLSQTITGGLRYLPHSLIHFYVFGSLFLAHSKVWVNGLSHNLSLLK